MSEEHNPNSNQGSRGRPHFSYFSAHPDPGSHVFHHPGNMQGLPNLRGNFDDPYNMQGSFEPRSTTMNNLAFSGAQLAADNFSSGRFAPNNILADLPQIPYSNAHIHSGMESRSGMSIAGNHGYNSSSSNIGSDGLYLPGQTSRPNLAVYSGSGNLNVQGQNRMMGDTGVFQHGSLQKQGVVHSVQQNPSVQQNQGSLQKQVDVPSVQQNQEFRIEAEDFPHLPGFKATQTSHRPQQQQPHTPSASGSIGVQSSMMGGTGAFQQGSLQKQGVPCVQQNTSVQQNQGSLQKQSDVLPRVQENQEFRIETENFPPLPGFKGSLQKQGVVGPSVEQNPSVQQNQGSLQKQDGDPRVQQNQEFRIETENFPPLPGFKGSLQKQGVVGPSVEQNPSVRQNQGSLQKQGDVLPSVQQNQEFRIETEDFPPLTGFKAKQASHRPQQQQQPHTPSASGSAVKNQEHFSRFDQNKLFYIFYSMPNSEAKIYAANELHNRDWMYDKEQKWWVTRVKGVEPLVKNSEYERGSFIIFDRKLWKEIRRDSYVLRYDKIESLPV